jgi:dTDP-4-dehydrorhamnose reductase
MTIEFNIAKRPRILLIGANGQVGWELRGTLAALGNVIPACMQGEGGPAIDLMTPGAVTRLVRRQTRTQS